MFNLTDLARATGLRPVILRARLRKLGVRRGKGRWYFDEAQFAALVERVKDSEPPPPPPKPAKRRLIPYAGKDETEALSLL